MWGFRMAVPSQQRFHRPILELASTPGADSLPVQEIRDALAQGFELSASDLAERVPSGQNRLMNRVHWAVSYLRRAGLVESPARARIRITAQGRKSLEAHSGDIDIRHLQDLIDSRTSKHPVKHGIGVEQPDVTALTPDERVAALHDELDEQLAEELIESIRKVSPYRFEQLMVRLLERMGYGEGQSVGGSGDGGIDGVMNQDLLGLEKVYVQAKRWENPVGEPEIRNFSGSLQAKGASKGVFVTTSTFSSTARETARIISAGNQFIRLIDGDELAHLMINHDVGVITETSYYVKKIDENYLAGDS